MSHKSVSISRIGGRDLNEDHAGHRRVGRTTCWVVCDGLGGHGGGDIASQVATEAALASFEGAPQVAPDAVKRHLEAAHAAVVEQQRTDRRRAQMRSTIVLLLTGGGRAVWGHVGDARLYHLHQGRVRAQTKDHSVVQALVNAGDISELEQGRHEDRNRLLRTLGQNEELNPTVLDEPITIGAGDRFLLCTDGVWETLSKLDIEIDLAGSPDPAQWLERLETRLVSRHAAASDNYTATAVFCTESSERTDEAVPATETAFADATTAAPPPRQPRTRREPVEPPPKRTAAPIERQAAVGPEPKARRLRPLHLVLALLVLLLVLLALLRYGDHPYRDGSYRGSGEAPAVAPPSEKALDQPVAPQQPNVENESEPSRDATAEETGER